MVDGLDKMQEKKQGGGGMEQAIQETENEIVQSR